MAYTIVVMSCDKNKDLWEPFYLCMEKYWKIHPRIIYSTETVTNPYYETICRNYPIDKWTKRVYDTIKDIPTKHILLMVDDIFLRDYVNDKLIFALKDYVVGNVASLNFEFSFDKVSFRSRAPASILSKRVGLFRQFSVGFKNYSTLFTPRAMSRFDR